MNVGHVSVVKCHHDIHRTVYIYLEHILLVNLQVVTGALPEVSGCRPCRQNVELCLAASPLVQLVASELSGVLTIFFFTFYDSRVRANTPQVLTLQYLVVVLFL